MRDHILLLYTLGFNIVNNGKVSSFPSGYFYLCMSIVGLMFLPAILTLVDIFSGSDSPRQEHIAKTPDIPINTIAIKAFPGDFRYYIKKRFSLKDDFVHLNSLIKQEIFGVSAYPGVLIGKNGFLFLGDDEAIRSSQGTNLFTSEEANAWKSSIANISDKLNQMGIQYVFLLAPNKHTIYKDQLPSWVLAGQKIENRADQLLAKLMQEKVAVINLEENLLKYEHAELDARLFYKTDTHWNEFGASLAFQSVLGALDSRVLRDPVPVPITTSHAGDLARMAGMLRRVDEDTWTVQLKEKFTCTRVDMRPFARNEIDPLNFGRMDCVNPTAQQGTALMFMDSFGVSMIPSFAESFKEITFVWQYSMDFDLVNEVKPDYVFHQIVERKLQSLNYQEL